MARFPELQTSLSRDFRNSYNEGVKKIDFSLDNAEANTKSALLKATTAEVNAANAKNTSTQVKEQLNNIILENGDSAPEIVAMRTDSEGNTFETAGDRLDNFNEQLADKAQFSDLTFTDVAQPLGASNKKVVHKVSDNEFGIISRRQSKNGFIFMKFQKNSGVAADADNQGGPYELLRLTGVYDVQKALGYMKPPSYTSSQLHTAGINDFQEASLVSDYNSTPVDVSNNSGRTIAGSYMEFPVTIKKSHAGILYLGFMGTSGSSKNLEVLVNGILVKTADISEPTQKIKIISVNVADFIGDVTVRIKLASTPNGFSVHFLGYNVIDVTELSDGLTYNKALYAVSGNHYISQSSGANDYAFREYNGKWLGSFHGGETSLSLNVLCDGVDITSLPNGTFTIGKKFEIIQTTNIMDKVKTQSLTRVYNDGVYEFNCFFKVLIPFDVSTFYTTMTCSNTAFSNVVYPLKIDTIPVGDYVLPNVMKVVQENPTTKQQIISLFTPVIGYKANIPVKVRKTTSVYCKLYHGKVVDSKGPMEDIGFSAVKIFD